MASNSTTTAASSISSTTAGISSTPSSISSSSSSIISTPSSSSSSSSFVSTTTVPSKTSVVTTPSGTTTVPASSSTTPSVVQTSVTRTVTQPISSGSNSAFFTTIISTQPAVTITPPASSASSGTSSSSPASSLHPSSKSSGGGGLSTGGTVAIAVVIPIVAVAAAVLFGLWFWRKRREKKNNQELRKEEMAQYGYNPNHDPTLPVGAAYTDGGSDGADESGYRGWGATSSNTRKPSTTLGSNSRAAAMAGAGGPTSDNGSQPGGYSYQSGPSNGQNSGSDGPLVETAGYGAAGAAAGGGLAAANNRTNTGGVHRGPSNASSAYSIAGGRAHSEASSDIPAMPTGGAYYHEEAPYNIYNDAQPGHGPYGDSTYGQDPQPVIRDVTARRNTRIERAPTMPQTQGGIAQNF